MRLDPPMIQTVLVQHLPATDSNFHPAG